LRTADDFSRGRLASIRKAFMRACVVAFAAFLVTMPALADTVDKPAVKPGDTWTYRATHQLGLVGHETHQVATVVRAGPSEVLLSIQEVGSTLPPRDQLVGADWSRFRNVDGKDTVVNRPFDFPLSPGKTWQVEYKDDHPTDRKHSSEKITEKYSVTGWEDVTVPAGTFKALKIECEGQWTAVIAPAVGAAAQTRSDAQGSTVVMQTNRAAPQTVTGRLYKAFWYVPSVKRWIKTDEEYFNTSGARSEVSSDELESYKLAP
jgi:hypothetical protein